MGCLLCGNFQCPGCGGAFVMRPPVTYEPLTIHNHLHDGLRHVGDVVKTNDFVIRHQFDSNGDIIGGMPEINPRFK